MIIRMLKREQDNSFLGSILDSQDIDIVVTRGNDCSILFMNAAAKERAKRAGVSTESCRDGYSQCFRGLCEECEGQGAPAAQSSEQAAVYDVQDLEGRICSVQANQVVWTDKKPAKALFIRDVDEERQVKNKLFSLAYLDHLTHIPNRQKLKDDFDKVLDEMRTSEICGVLGIFDLDNFKGINDTYGHNTGDVMLMRLTKHLQENPLFKDHLYRLGGDEFVFLYQDKPEKFPDNESLQNYYNELLSKALQAYSMPNIDLSCTISMGVAVFPLHGESFSELLRKADIALYMAKAAGRNRLVFFEDRYDKAKKFKDLYISIQPIMNMDEQSYGYELVDRSNEYDTNEQKVDLLDADRALDALNLGDLENNAKYFISYSSQLLNPSVLRNLPKEKFIIQLPSMDEVGRQEMDNYRNLKKYGYYLALAGIKRENVNPELIELVRYCKFDEQDKEFVWQQRFMREHSGKVFIATNVDTAYALEAAKVQGFKLFQGFYFEEQTVVKKTKDISPLKVNYYRLLRLTSTDDYVNFKEISTVIGSDVALSYKLLQLLNSAAVGLKNQISSIEMAVAYLGEENLKKWIAMLALRGIAAGKPLELVRVSLIRARFAELLAPHYIPPRNEKHVFLIGMFSLLHIALDRSKEDLFDDIPVAENIKNSLLRSDGIYSDLMPFFSNYEYGNWEEVSRYGLEHGLNDILVSDSYIKAVKWYNDIEKS